LDCGFILIKFIGFFIEILKRRPDSG